MTLNKTEEKQLELITPFLDELQKFVDDNIKESSALTAAGVYEKFTPGSNCKLTADDFIKSFRIAVKSGKITGIESAKRLGYRRIGEKVVTKTMPDMALAGIEPYLGALQVWIDQRIQGEVRMTAAVIYTKFKNEKGCVLEEEDFIKSFRLALREGKLTGLESAYRFGYKRIGSGPVKEREDTTSTEEEIDTRCEIIIDDRRKIVPLDRLNWGLQTRKDSGTWVTEAYFPNISSHVRCIAIKLLDSELKNIPRFHLEQLEEKFAEAEKRITNLLQALMNSRVAA